MIGLPAGTRVWLVAGSWSKKADQARGRGQEVRARDREIDRLAGFDAAGKPQTRSPKRDITVNNLMLHTLGFCYEFLSADDLK